jgi:DNA repair protein RadA
MSEIELLKGVGSSALTKFQSINLTTIEELSQTDVSVLIKAGFTENAANKFIKSAKESIEKSSFISGIELIERENERERLTTNVPELNDLVRGGIPTSAITQIYGEYGSGKSQFVHQLAINTCLPKSVGGLDGSVVWIDTEETSSPYRLREMVKGVPFIHGIDVNEEDILNRIHIASTATVELQFTQTNAAFVKAEDLLAAGKPPVKLLIVDSLIALFRNEYIGRGTLSDRQQIIGQYLNSLRLFAINHKAVVVVTNQVQSNPATFFGDPNKPTGGNIVGHQCKYIFAIYKSKEGKRKFSLKDAPDCPDGEAIAVLTTHGFVPTDFDIDVFDESPKKVKAEPKTSVDNIELID